MRTLISSLLLASATMTSAYAATAITTSAASQPSIVEIQTNVGTITTQLNWDKAPLSSKNFLDYANKGFYNNIVFHRVIKDFMLQTGGVDVSTGKFKTPDAPIVSEANNGLKNLKYTIAMARTADVNSATSQFFINTVDNALLDKSDKSDGYTVFADVISGKEIVDKLNNALTIKTAYSIDGGVPVIADGVYECGFNFCLRKIYIENVYTNNVVDSINSWTRVSVNGKGGRVTSTPRGISCRVTSKSCVLKKPFGTAVSLTTTPSKGYEFKGWSGDCTGVTPTLDVDTLTKNHNCTATFAKIGSL